MSEYHRKLHSLLPFLHFWTDSKVNPFQMPHERRCTTCGALQHRFYEGFACRPTDWIDGPHPGFAQDSAVARTDLKSTKTQDD